MRYGNIKCSCGQVFYFESASEVIKCIKCGKHYNILKHPKNEYPQDHLEEIAENERV